MGQLETSPNPGASLVVPKRGAAKLGAGLGMQFEAHVAPPYFLVDGPAKGTIRVHAPEGFCT
jgi:hypothetical protein